MFMLFFLSLEYGGNPVTVRFRATPAREQDPTESIGGGAPLGKKFMWGWNFLSLNSRPAHPLHLFPSPEADPRYTHPYPGKFTKYVYFLFLLILRIY